MYVYNTSYTQSYMHSVFLALKVVTYSFIPVGFVFYQGNDKTDSRRYRNPIDSTRCGPSVVRSSVS